MTEFKDLTYRGQIRFLRELATEALKQFPIKVRELEFINHGENTTFKVSAIGGRRYLLRVHRDDYHTAEGIEEEFKWLRRLRRLESISVPQPVRSKRGRLFERVSTSRLPQGRHCGLFEWVDGKFVRNSATASHLNRLGDAIAQLHDFSGRDQVIHRRYWDSEGLLGAKPKFGNIDRLTGVSEKRQAAITEGRKYLLSRLKRFEKKFPKRTGLIHADLHFGNFLVQKERLGMIDFDDSGFGFFGYDVAIPVHSLSHAAKSRKLSKFEAQRLVDALINGYAKRRTWDQHDQEMLEVFLMARRLLMLGWLDTRSEIPRLRKYLKWASGDAAKRLKKDWGIG